MILSLVVGKFRIVERRTSNEDLIEQCPHAVQIDTQGVILFGDYLRGHVLHTSTVGIRLLSDLFGKSEVSQLGVPFTIDQNILWLYVPEHYIPFMQVLYGQQDLCENNPGLLL